MYRDCNVKITIHCNHTCNLEVSFEVTPAKLDFLLEVTLAILGPVRTGYCPVPGTVQYDEVQLYGTTGTGRYRYYRYRWPVQPRTVQ